MDTNWCLSCSRYIDDGHPYCSIQCHENDNLPYEDDSDFCEQIIPVSFVERVDLSSFRYTGRDREGISVWASQIPFSYPLSSPPSIEDIPPLPRSSPSSSGRTLRPPVLLLNQTRALPPTLCISSPKPATPIPSAPIQANSLSKRRTVISGGGSMSTVPTESLATPASAVKPDAKSTAAANLWSQLATQVRCWVGSSSGVPNDKSPEQPAIVEMDDQTLVPSTKNRVSSPGDRSSAIMAPVAKLKWSSTVQPFTDLSDCDSEGERPYALAPALKSSPTPAPQQGRPLSSESVLDLLVEELHPAFPSRGRQMARGM